MGAFPVNADHWHVATTRDGALRISPERQDRETAVMAVRDLLVHDGNVTGDRRYADAVCAIDRGYCSYRINGLFYVAFACACPGPVR